MTRPTRTGSPRLIRVERRWFMAAIVSGLLAMPLRGDAQQAGKVYRLGILYSQLPSTPPGQGPFYDRMRELGWVYGRDFVAEERGFNGQYERVPELAAELIRSGVDLFVVQGGAEAVRMQPVTRKIPIVTTMAGDLVLSGVAASLGRPGGNVTGVQTLSSQLIGKHFSLLRETMPRLGRVGVLLHVSDPSSITPFDAATLREGEAAGKALDIVIQVVKAHASGELEKAFGAFQAQRAQGIVILRDAFMGAHLQTLADLALRYRLPAACEIASFAQRGGLMSYGYDFDAALRTAAGIIDKILRGANVSEVPIQQASTFRFTINLRTAKTLGLTISPSLLAQADQVIE